MAPWQLLAHLPDLADNECMGPRLSEFEKNRILGLGWGVGHMQSCPSTHHLAVAADSVGQFDKQAVGPGQEHAHWYEKCLRGQMPRLDHVCLCSPALARERGAMAAVAHGRYRHLLVFAPPHSRPHSTCADVAVTMQMRTRHAPVISVESNSHCVLTPWNQSEAAASSCCLLACMRRLARAILGHLQQPDDVVLREPSPGICIHIISIPVSSSTHPCTSFSGFLTQIHKGHGSNDTCIRVWWWYRSSTVHNSFQYLFSASEANVKQRWDKTDRRL
jgi:hypothetical protein